MKISLITIIFIFLAFLACNQAEEKRVGLKSNIPLTKQFLIKSEWRIDSVYGSNEFIQDWVYFTEDNKFWRCSYYNESYIIDSSVEYNDNVVSSNGQPKYEIYTIDSNNILLVTGDSKTFHCKRWNDFSDKRIKAFIKSNPKKRLLNGVWLLDSSELGSTRIPSYCDSLYPGTKFYFNSDGTFDVYAKNSAEKCNGYSYKIFDDEISFTEYDMDMAFDIVRLTSDSLILKSNYVPNKLWSSEARKSGYKLYLTRRM